MRKIESDAGYFYAFMFMIDEEESLVALNVLSFEHELTANDFSVLQAMFYMDEDSSSEISARLKVSNSEESFYVIDLKQISRSAVKNLKTMTAMHSPLWCRRS